MRALFSSMRDHWARLDPTTKWIIGTLVAIVLLGAGFLLIADEVGEGDTQAFDQAILLALRAPNNPVEPAGPVWLQDAARDLTSLGSFSILSLVFVLVVGFLLLIGRRRVAGWVAGTVLGGTLLSTLLKLHYDRPRPDLGVALPVFTSSFPSGHALISTVVYLTLGSMLARSTASRALKGYFFLAAVVLSLIIGVTRVYLGVHFPTDVLAGWAIGAAWAGLCFIISLAVAPKLDAHLI